MKSVKISALMLIISFALGINSYAASFDDISGHWAEDIIISLSDRGIVNGVSDTKFNPEGIVTRAEFLTMAMRSVGIKPVPYRYGRCLEARSTDWYATYLQSALDKGLVPENMITGYNVKVEQNKNGEWEAIYGGAFNGGLPINREEMAVIAQYVYQYTRNANTMKAMQAGKTLEFSDNDKISDWAYDSVQLAFAQGFIGGMDDGSFAPGITATRAQAATIISRIIARQEG